MEPTTWTYLIANLGFPITLAIVLLVWIRHIHRESVEREIRLGDRIDELENRDREHLVNLTADCATAIRESYRCTRRLTAAVDELVRVTGMRLALDEDSFYPHPSVRAKHGMPSPAAPSGETTDEATRDVPQKKSPQRPLSAGLKPRDRDG